MDETCANCGRRIASDEARAITGECVSCWWKSKRPVQHVAVELTKPELDEVIAALGGSPGTNGVKGPLLVELTKLRMVAFYDRPAEPPAGEGGGPK